MEGKIIGKVPDWVIDKIKLGEAKALEEEATLIYDKSTNQFSVKLPIRIMYEVEWHGGDKIVVKIDGKGIKLERKDD